MKGSVKKHKNKDCWGKGEPMATGSAYSKAKAAVTLHKFRSQRALDDLEMMNALQCKLQQEGRTLLQGHPGWATSTQPCKEGSGAAA